MTSAVESLDDRVLAFLDKGHTRADFLEAVEVCRAAGLTLVPTFVAFHPWLTLRRLLRSARTRSRELDLVDHVAPIQLAIRLLVPDGSRLLELPELRAHLDAFDPATLAYPWMHADPRVDALHRDVTDAGRHASDIRSARHLRRDSSARARARRPAAAESGRRRLSARVPYLNEPWYCCAEPNPDDVRLI